MGGHISSWGIFGGRGQKDIASSSLSYECIMLLHRVSNESQFHMTDTGAELQINNKEL